MDNDNDVQVIDVEQYKSGVEQQFSHQHLVMKSMNRCLENGCKEMRPGYWIKKTDKQGNLASIYIPDARKEFIESVKTTMMIMSCDLDKPSEDSISIIKVELDRELARLCAVEKKNWDTISQTIRMSRWSKGIFFQEGSLNLNLQYYQDYLEFEVTAYRKIFVELTKLTKRLEFYIEPDYEA